MAGFLLGGLIPIAYASGTPSASPNWGKTSDDQQNSDTPQDTTEDNQQNTDTPQDPSLRTEKVLVLVLDSSLDSAQIKSAKSIYDQGMEANKNGDYQKAKALFEQALSINSNNPDILNMLAHTQLKVGLIDESLENYKKALKLRPRFAEAREYLGETYIQAALRELTTLKSYGKDGAEQAEDLEKEIKEAGAGT